MRGRLILAITLVANGAYAVPPGGEADPPQPKPVDANPVPAPATDAGGPGETCKSRADCQAGLRCIAETCRDGSYRPSSFTPPREAVENTDHDDWLGFDLGKGAHALLGMSVGGGLATTITTRFVNGFNDPRATTTSATFAYALRGGVVFNRFEAAIEITPMTALSPAAGETCTPNLGFQMPQCFSTNGPHFSLAGTAGTWIPLVRGKQMNVDWPVRLGAGFIENASDRPYFLAVGDVIGFNVRVGHFSFGMHLPSFRYAFAPEQIGAPGRHILFWLFGGDLGYVF